VLLGLRHFFARLLIPGQLEEREPAGLIGTGTSSYPASAAIDAARVGNAWLHASVSDRAADLAGLPLILVRGRGAAATEIEDHPVLDLLAEPSTGMAGELWRRQLVLDLELAGNHYAALVGLTEPESILRLHPAHVTVEGGRFGIDRYVYTDEAGRLELEPDEVLHIRRPSLHDGASTHVGTGVVEVLDEELSAAYWLTRRLATDAKQGHPSWMLAPRTDSQQQYTADQLQTLVDRFRAKLSERQPVIALGGAVEATALSHKPSDLDPSGTREHARQTIMATTGQVPVRLGLETANYAQSREMMRLYWRGLQADARLIDAGLTRVARLFDRQLSIRHDFSGVEALQEDRTQAQARALVWMERFGLEPAYAAALEGFEDVDFSRATPVVAPEPTMPTREIREELQAALVLLEREGDEPEAVADALASIAWVLGVEPEVESLEAG